MTKTRIADDFEAIARARRAIKIREWVARALAMYDEPGITLKRHFVFKGRPYNPHYAIDHPDCRCDEIGAGTHYPELERQEAAEAQRRIDQERRYRELGRTADVAHDFAGFDVRHSQQVERQEPGTSIAFDAAERDGFLCVNELPKWLFSVDLGTGKDVVVKFLVDKQGIPRPLP